MKIRIRNSFFCLFHVLSTICIAERTRLFYCYCYNALYPYKVRVSTRKHSANYNRSKNKTTFILCLFQNSSCQVDKDQEVSK